jgi:methyl-accepting chemotaxis protein
MTNQKKLEEKALELIRQNKYLSAVNLFIEDGKEELQAYSKAFDLAYAFPVDRAIRTQVYNIFMAKMDEREAEIIGRIMNKVAGINGMLDETREVLGDISDRLE